jgi:hypothetical protein
VIPTGGEKKSLSALVGRWEGTYTNPGNGRTGTIVLEFSSGGKVANGDILMIPPDSTARKPSAEETLRTMPQVYEINFIDAAGSGLTGTVGPYEDPTFHCSAHSEFQGTLQGDTITGTFRTECLDPQGKPDPRAPATGQSRERKFKEVTDEIQGSSHCGHRRRPGVLDVEDVRRLRPEDEFLPVQDLGLEG